MWIDKYLFIYKQLDLERQGDKWIEKQLDLERQGDKWIEKQLDRYVHILWLCVKMKG